jgi:hypothetical protein
MVTRLVFLGLQGLPITVDTLPWNLVKPAAYLANSMDYNACDDEYELM